MGDPAATIDTTITYLEMRSRPDRPRAVAPHDPVRLEHACQPTVSFYRYLYETVGGPWLWTERRLMSDEQLASIVRDPLVEVWVLSDHGVPAGYGEIDRREPPDIELAYFGLIPEFIGRRLGHYLLDAIVDIAWDHQPQRLWVHTCDLDHPAALPLYQQAGFEIYDRQPGYVRLLPGQVHGLARV